MWGEMPPTLLWLGEAVVPPPALAATHVWRVCELAAGVTKVSIPPPLLAFSTFSDELAHVGRLFGLLLHQCLNLLHEVADFLRDACCCLPLHPGHAAAISTTTPLFPHQKSGPLRQGQDKLSQVLVMKLAPRLEGVTSMHPSL